MSRARYFEVAVDNAGRPLASVSVNVYQAGTTTAITETIYAADTGGTTLSNPLTANAQGEIEFFLAVPKRVSLAWSKSGYTAESHPADVIAADLFVLAASAGVANGVATLDGSGFVPIGQLPNAAALDAEVTAAVAAHDDDAAAHALLSGTTRAPLAANPDSIIFGTITRDANGAATSAPVIWPDGAVGTYTATTVSTAFPGSVDAYTVTYGSPVTTTYTQPAVTRDATTGAVTVRPALVVT